MSGTPASPATSPVSKFSFLASHGLRSPLSSIRWACGRLRKSSTGSLNDEQRELVQEIHANAKILTTVLGSMQLLGKLEDHSYRLKKESIRISDMLTSLTHGLEHPRDVEWNVDCPEELSVLTDGPILESILVNLLTVCMEAGIDPKETHIAATRTGESVAVSLHAQLELPFLHSGDDKGDDAARLVGGVPGLMLCLASAMAQFLKGKVQLHEVEGTPKIRRSGSGVSSYREYRVTLTLDGQA